MAKTDPAHEATDRLIEEMNRKLATEYRQAAEEVEEKLNDYWRRFQVKDEIWQLQVAKGEKTAEEYRMWRESQLINGERWEELRDTLAADLHRSNDAARRIVRGYQAEVYAENHNYATYEVEHAANINTGAVLYNREAVERIMQDNPDVLPGVREGKGADVNLGAKIPKTKDERWQAGKIQSVTVQSILQGESIPNMARRISRELGTANYKSAVRYARTASTAAENAGRRDAYQHMEEIGVVMMQEWRATYDERTRHEHRLLDGQKVPVGEPFEVDGYEIMYPGDPNAEPFLVWNCRCSVRAAVSGLEPRARQYRSNAAAGGMTYDEWLEATPKSRDIEYQTRVGEAIRGSYIAEYKAAREALEGDED